MNMLSPKKTKYRKQFKGRIHGLSKGNYALNYGSYGLKAIEPERVTSRQIEAARKAITRYLKRAGRMWIRIFPDVPVSKKPAEVRMGKGKGSIEYWACRVKPGRIMFEVDGVNIDSKKLQEEIISLKKTLLNLSFQKFSGQLEKTSQIKATRKQIARIKAMLSKKNGEENA